MSSNQDGVFGPTRDRRDVTLSKTELVVPVLQINVHLPSNISNKVSIFNDFNDFNSSFFFKQF